MKSTLDLTKIFVYNRDAGVILKQNDKLLMDVDNEVMELVEPYDDKKDLKVLAFNNKLFSLYFRYITKFDEVFPFNEEVVCIPRRELNMFPAAGCITNETSLHALLQLVAVGIYKDLHGDKGVDPRHRVKNLTLDIVENNDVITITFKE